MINLVCCSRCNGKGYIPRFWHIQDGICFSCSGSGQIQKSLQTIPGHDEWYRKAREKSLAKTNIMAAWKIL